MVANDRNNAHLKHVQKCQTLVTKNIKKIFCRSFMTCIIMLSMNFKQTKMEGVTERHLPKTDESIVWPAGERH